MRAFVAFHILFYSLMWLSKTVHLLYFEEQHAVFNFGLSYSAMACAGYFSFFMGHLTDVWGFRRGLVVGGVLYGLGLVLRAFPDSSTVAVVSGCVAGLGASTCLGAMRVWMTTLSTDKSTERWVGIKGSATALGTAVGCGLVAVAPWGFRELLLLSGAGMLTMVGLIVRFVPPAAHPAPNWPRTSPWEGLAELFREHHRLFVATSVLGVTTGVYVSFIGPYLPLIMKEKGLTLTAIGLSTGALALVRFFCDPWVAGLVARFKNRGLAIYLIAEALIALVTAAFLLPVSPVGFVGFLLVRALFLGVSAISEEILWLRLFPKDRLGLFFGLNQSAFFVGDFVGGLVNGHLYKNFGLGTSIAVVLGIMLINSVLFMIMLNRRAGRDGSRLMVAA